MNQASESNRFGQAASLLEQALIPLVETALKKEYGEGWTVAVSAPVQGDRVTWDVASLLETIRGNPDLFTKSVQDQVTPLERLWSKKERLSGPEERELTDHARALLAQVAPGTETQLVIEPLPQASPPDVEEELGIDEEEPAAEAEDLASPTPAAEDVAPPASLSETFIDDEAASPDVEAAPPPSPPPIQQPDPEPDTTDAEELEQELVTSGVPQRSSPARLLSTLALLSSIVVIALAVWWMRRPQAPPPKTDKQVVRPASTPAVPLPPKPQRVVSKPVPVASVPKEAAAPAPAVKPEAPKQATPPAKHVEPEPPASAPERRPQREYRAPEQKTDEATRPTPALPKSPREPLTVVALCPPASSHLVLLGAWGPKSHWVLHPPFDQAPPPVWRSLRWRLYSRALKRPFAAETPPARWRVGNDMDYLRISQLNGTPPSASDPHDEYGPVLGGSAHALAIPEGCRVRTAVLKRYQETADECQKRTAELLKEMGIGAPFTLALHEAFTVDLNGDGKEELLWTALSRSESVAFSLLAVRFRYKLRSKNYVDLNPLILDFGNDIKAPAELLPPVDLNGDGKLELVALHDNPPRPEAFGFAVNFAYGLWDTRLPR